jgi:hypothetical protein
LTEIVTNSEFLLSLDRKPNGRVDEDNPFDNVEGSEFNHIKFNPEQYHKYCPGCESKQNEITYLRSLVDNFIGINRFNKQVVSGDSAVNIITSNHNSNNNQPITGPIRTPSQFRRAVANADRQASKNKITQKIDEIESGDVVPLNLKETQVDD